MEIPQAAEPDVLGLPIRRQLIEALVGLRRSATTPELATLVGRHPNSVRVQLHRLANAGLLELRHMPPRRGRPRHEWAIATGARPAGGPPEAYGQLGRWLARAIADRSEADLERIERAGREIGEELAPAGNGRPPADAMRDALTALGFQPALEPLPPGGVRYVLGNCPYRDAVRENQPVICTLHRGITQGLLGKVAPAARLSDFVARDPYSAGCLIDVSDLSAAD